MVHELIDPDLPPNRDILDYLRSFAVGNADAHLSDRGWELHTHPDVHIQIRELVPEGQPVVLAYGVTVVPVNGIIALAAPSMGVMRVRIPVPPDLQVPPHRQPRDDVSEPVAGWHSAWAFCTKDMKPKLRELIAAAIQHTAKLT